MNVKFLKKLLGMLVGHLKCMLHKLQRLKEVENLKVKEKEMKNKSKVLQ